MTNASLYKCFESHLMDTDIIVESEDAFITKVVEIYLLELSAGGYHFIREGEDTYQEIRDEVVEILRKKIYGHMSVNAYRDSLRQSR